MNDRVRELECVISDLKQQSRDAEKVRDDLLEALQHVALTISADDYLLDCFQTGYAKARTAIARATGE